MAGAASDTPGRFAVNCSQFESLALGANRRRSTVTADEELCGVVISSSPVAPVCPAS